MRIAKPKPVPKFYTDRPDTHTHSDTGGKGHGGYPARNQIFPFRMSFYEKNELYRLAKTHRTSVAYMIRAALEKVYPKIFVGTNHNIRRRKPIKLENTKAIITTSYADGKISVQEASGDK